MELTGAAREGYEASRAGYETHHCPYAYGTYDHVAWHRGWEQAEKEYYEAP